MKKLILTWLIVGSFASQGYFDAPTGERVYWKWFNEEVGVIDTNGRCVWNDGQPRDCNAEELSKMLYIME